MGATVTPHSAAQIALREADKPVLVPYNLLRSASYVKLRHASGDFSQADQSSTSYPRAQLYDGHRTTQGRTASASTTGYVLVDFGSDLSVDTIIIEGELVTGDTVTVQASTALTGGTTLTTPTTVMNVAINTSRHVELPDSTYAARYWLFTFTGGGNAVRGFRQIWLAARVQLSHGAKVPGDLDERVSVFSSYTTESGATIRTERAYNLRSVDHVLPLGTTAEHTLVESAYASARGWTAPIWYIRQPNTDQHTGAIYLAVKSGELSKPDFTGGTSGGKAEWNLQGVEVGPRIL